MVTTMAKIVRNGQLTIPARIRKLLHLHDGDLVRFAVEDSHLVITPVAVVEKGQEYFFKDDVQKQIRESEAAIKKGKCKTYSSVDKLSKDLGLEDD